MNTSRPPVPAADRPHGRGSLRAILGACASLRLTVGLLCLSLVMIFVATLDQVHLGVWGVQQKYFHAFLVWVKLPGTAISLPVFPGGYLLGGALLVNLITAHLCRFRLSAKKAGIWLTHCGLILLLIGEGVSGLLQRDGQVRLDVGQSQRYVESFRENELAVTDTTDPRNDLVVAIPVAHLQATETLQDPRLPFSIRPVAFFENAKLRVRSQLTTPPPAVATAGDGTDLLVDPAPVTYKPDETNWPSSYIELAGPDGPLGTWLVSTLLEQPQTFTYQGRSWQLALRARRDYLPFTLTLKKFTHDIYPGTDIPKNFASTLQLRGDSGGDDRVVQISMNKPLRTAGYAFYQAGFANNDRTSVLQAVRNPSWQIPYWSCGMIALGLLVQFGLGLFGSLRRRSAAASAVRQPAPLPL